MFPSTGTKPGYGVCVSFEPLLDTLTGECVILKMFFFSPKLLCTVGKHQTFQRPGESLDANTATTKTQEKTHQL